MATTAPERPADFYRLYPDLENINYYRKGGYHPVHIGDIMHNRYRVVNKLGYGAYATVWLVKDLDSGQYASLKIIAAEATNSASEIAVLRHLKAAQASSPGIPGGEFVRMVAQIAQGVAYLHRIGIVHGDLHLKNILLYASGKRFWQSIDGEDGELLDEVCEWYYSLDELSELPVPRVIRVAQNLFEYAPYPLSWVSRIGTNELLCQCVHIYDPLQTCHLWVSRALASERREDLELQYLASPPVVMQIFRDDDSEGTARPRWLRYDQNELIYKTRPTCDIIPLYTALALKRENAAKKLAIHKWCSGIEPDLHAWGLIASS
ncbi:kinase-like domain-containing protein [Hygrophoropsis aurantiaca]|uniref:Kinase-like domain-containing protein n=1 Tax=Hygrophoropsis aurantiaca TaxID=72124 RepID=A0ACB8A2S5_9AGAM|nr:kinase-like domain-containing protein [Hygrophoropsis aurantiaca]